MKIGTKVLMSVLCVGALGGLATMGVFAAFTSTTTNANNQITAGTVALADNDSNAAMYTLTGAAPGDSVTKCIKVTYTGSVAADVKLYTTSTIGSLGQYIDLTITPGTQSSPSFPSCTGFSADAGGALFNGTLAAFGTGKNSYANGITDNPGTSATKWVANDAVVYQITATLQSSAPDVAQGLTTGMHAFTWEARNQ